MTAEILIPILVGLLAVVLIFVIWPRLLRYVWQFVRNILVGWGLFWVIGMLMGPSWQVGYNPFTAAVCGVLGLPGCALLLLLLRVP